MPQHLEDEVALSGYFERYVAAGKSGGVRFVLADPRAALDAFRRLRRLPVVEFVPGRDGEARRVHEALTARPGWRVLREAVGLLELPDDPAAFRAGGSKRSLRKKTQYAQRAGVTWRPVDDPDERRRLLAAADAYERSEAQDGYRNAGADNSGLLGVELWLAAFDRDGEPLVLAVAAHSGAWASFDYFRTLRASPEASDARYLLTGAVVDALIARGVTRLFDTVHPIHLPNGLRHFQRMVGFRIVRVRFPDLPPEPTDRLRRTLSASPDAARRRISR